MNDVDLARRGLHTRDADEMVVWDGVAGHHLGLGHAHVSFTKGFRKTSDVECTELHRHGILHGMILNYDNIVVATKAWNRLFAVADWATSRDKQAIPVEPRPTWGQLLKQLACTAAARKALDEWCPCTLHPGDPGFEDHEAFRSTAAYLTVWQRKNYGAMAAHIPNVLAEQTQSATAGMVRSVMQFHDLREFSIGGIQSQTPAACEVTAMLASAFHARTPSELGGSTKLAVL